MGTEATVSAASLANLSFCRCCVCGCAESRIKAEEGTRTHLSPPRPWTVQTSGFSAADQFQSNAQRLIVIMNCLVY